MGAGANMPAIKSAVSTAIIRTKFLVGEYIAVSPFSDEATVV